MLYHAYTALQALGQPATALAGLGSHLWGETKWLSHLPGAERLAAQYEVAHRLGKPYPKPAFGISSVTRDKDTLAILEQEEYCTPFCRLIRFKRLSDNASLITTCTAEPRVLVVAPLSGHYATLLRDTVRTLLPTHNVWITDWQNGRDVPVQEGPFSLDTYVMTLRNLIRDLVQQGPLHLLAVCQPSVPVLGALSLMASAEEPLPKSVTLMGGPVDARCSPTAVNLLATRHPLSWFEQHVIHPVPPPYAGVGRRVYPGFLQHLGFMALQPRRHTQSHWDFYQHLIQGDEDGAEAHRRFYDEYNAVMDLPAEYYLDTVHTVFQDFSLAKGTWHVEGKRIAPEALRGLHLLTIEGELDDISGSGQTRAAQTLCRSLTDAQRQHLDVKGAGHYGIFSGTRWRKDVAPVVADFMRRSEKAGS